MSEQASRFKRKRSDNNHADSPGLARPQEQLAIRVTDLGNGAMVLYQPASFDALEAARFFRQLQDEVVWEQREITVMGRKVLQPRLVAYMADDASLQMTYSRTTVFPVPFSPAVLAIKAKVEALAGESFNSCLLNLYRNGRDHVSWHSDNEVLYGSNPTVGSASFGAARDFLLRSNADHTVKHSYLLGPGDLLIMAGTLQKHWMHSIPKRARVAEPRISLTFRKVVNPEKPAAPRLS